MLRRVYANRRLVPFPTQTLGRKKSSEAAPTTEESNGGDLTPPPPPPPPIEGEFRTLQILPPKAIEWEKRPTPEWKKNLPPPRCTKMSTTQDWKSVWPAARMFNPAIVPLPIHMGYIERPDRYAPPDKWANAELMKIPNFLHLTPPAIKAHCQAIKKFCTPWPKELETDQDCEKHFPIEIVYRDYVHSGASIRDPRARIVNMRFKLSALPLDDHAKDKMKRILNSSVIDPRYKFETPFMKQRKRDYLKKQQEDERPRYQENTDMVTLVGKRCPLRKQNYDYVQYLLTACYFESWKIEDWEWEKTREDWERFFYDKSPSYRRVQEYQKKMDQEGKPVEGVKDYEKSLIALYDQGETHVTVHDYKKATLKMLFGKTSTEDMEIIPPPDSETAVNPPPTPHITPPWIPDSKRVLSWIKKDNPNRKKWGGF